MQKLIYILLLSIALGACSTEDRNKSANVIWLLCEDMSPDLGCNGNALVYTPTIDSLASQGVLFENVFTTAAVCTPSRTALASGMYQTSINAHHMRYYSEELKNELPKPVLPLNEILRQNGYQTANVKSAYSTGKNDWSFKAEGENFDYSKWEEIDSEKPFFAVVNFSLTHRGFARDKNRPVNPDKVKVPPYYPNNSVVREDFAAYYESIQILDKKVAQALKDIRKYGLDKNTVICFFSDHGRPMTRGKMFTYDSGLKIPLIVSVANTDDWETTFKAGTKNKRLHSSIDISATTLELAGIDIPHWMQGQSFVNDKTEEREAVFSASDRIGGTELKTRSVRTKKYRYNRNYINDISVNEAATYYRKAMHPIYHVLDILNANGELGEVQKSLVMPLPEEELYDIENDPFQTINLAANEDYKGVLNEMHTRLEKWQNETTDYGMLPDSPELKKSFEEYKTRSQKNNADRITKLRASVQQKLQNEKN